MSSPVSHCAHTSVHVDLISWSRCVTKKLFINQSVIHCKMPQGDLIFKVIPCWVPSRRQASFGKISNHKPLLWILWLDFSPLWFLQGEGTASTNLSSGHCQHMYVLVCFSEVSLVTNALGMGSRFWFWKTLGHRHKVPWLDLIVETFRPPLQNARAK